MLSCKILTVNAVEPEGGLVNLKLKTSSVTVRVKVCADDRSKVTTLLAEVTTTAEKTDIYSFMTFDGGSSLFGVVGGQNFA